MIITINIIQLFENEGCKSTLQEQATLLLVISLHGAKF